MSSVDPTTSSTPASDSSGVSGSSASSGTPPSGSPPSGSAPGANEKFDGTLAGLAALPDGEKLINKMIESIAMHICQDMDKQQKKAIANAKKQRQQDQ